MASTAATPPPPPPPPPSHSPSSTSVSVSQTSPRSTLSPDSSNMHKSSIRSGSTSAEMPAFDQQDDDGDTFHHMLSIHLDQPVGSMSISPSNRDVALGARKGLFIVDLQNPWDPPRFLPHHSAWEVADVQWNPFPSRSEWVVSTSSQQAIVYNLSFSPSFAASHIEHTLHAHSRAVTDINWSPGCPEILATCGLDGRVLSWDLRTGYGSGAGGSRKPVWGVCSWGSGATQVKWNRREPHVIASAHDNKVLIWDDRFGAAPVTEIQGHDAKIYGIDWSRKDARKLVTCSLDKSFKSWSLDDPSHSLLAVQTSSPVWRARFLPFGDGVLTLPQRSDHALSIWGREKVLQGNTAEPVARFEGAREGVKEFVWRTRGGSDLDVDDRQFQLVTWAKDRRLRLWPISDEIMRDVGHVEGAPITIPMTRRGGPDISYRTFTETAAAPPVPFSIVSSPPPAMPRHLASGPSLLSASLSGSPPPTPSLLTSSLLAASFNAGPSPLIHSAPPLTSDPRHGAATMTTSSVGNRRQKAHARLAWMEGVKVIKAPIVAPESDLHALNDGQQGIVSDNGDSRAQTRSSSLQRGTDGGTAREGGETERADSVLSPGSTKTGTAIAKEPQYSSLGEEFTTLTRRFPRIRFEKCSVAGRTCTVSLYSPLFLRATFTFPRNYPHSAAPAIELERNADVTLKSRAALLQGVRKLMAVRAQRGAHSLEHALRYLLGDRSLLNDKPGLDEDEDDEEVDDALEDEAAGTVPAGVLRSNLRVNVPPPRRCGASFGPQGQLVVFFPSDVLSSPASHDDAPPVEEDSAMDRAKGPARLSEAFGTIVLSSSEARDQDYQETDEALQLVTAHSIRSSNAFAAKPFASSAQPAVPTFSTSVKIKDISHLDLARPERISCPLDGDPLEVARAAFESATRRKDVFLIKVWTTLTCLLESGSAPRGATRQLSTLLAERLLPDLMSFLVHLRDIPTLGIIACLLEAFTRGHARNLKDMTVAPRSPPVDYFSHRKTATAASDSTMPYDSAPTPLASAGTYRLGRPSDSSPKPSWANLSGFFNNTVLSLRSGVSSGSPGSPDRPGPLVRAMSTSSLSQLTTASTPRVSPVGKTPMRTSQGHEEGSEPKSVTGNGTEMKPSLSKQTSSRGPNKISKGSPNVVTFGTTSVALIGSGGGGLSTKAPATTAPTSAQIGSKDRNKKVVVSFPEPQVSSLSLPRPWWLTENARIELELLRLAYAELLLRWGYGHERLRVLKYCFSASAPSAAQDFGSQLVRKSNGLGSSSSILISRPCAHCRSMPKTPGAPCHVCHRRPKDVLCSLCHLSVNALSSSCTLCAHVLHLGCARSWYSTELSCCTGCGCRCVSDGGLAGVFVLPETKPPSETLTRGKSQRGSGLRGSLPFFV